MAKQDRAIRTRQTILAAAAKVFEERGYQAATITDILDAAGVTKGALYFHFHSKEDLAHGVLAEQDRKLVVPPRSCKIQEVVDTTMLQAYRMQTDPMVRAGARLSLDQRATELDRSGPFTRWTEVMTSLLEEAQRQGELLPHINPQETAELLVGAFGGVQSMSQTLSDYQDLGHRVTVLLRHILPNVALSSVLVSVNLSDARGATVFAEATAARDAETAASHETAVPAGTAA